LTIPQLRGEPPAHVHPPVAVRMSREAARNWYIPLRHNCAPFHMRAEDVKTTLRSV
jgi:hypothetical protein